MFRPMGTQVHRGARRLMVMVVAGLFGSAPLEAQTIRGRVIDDSDERPVPSALVRLVDEAGTQVAATAADSVGRYRLLAPAPGVYRLLAERFGYDDFETPLLEAVSSDGTYALDLLLHSSPIPIRGIEVSAAQVDQQVRLMTGVDPRRLRWQPIREEELARHVEQAHDLTALMRWSNLPSIDVRESLEGPCYLMRRYGCLPVYLDGFELIPDAFDAVPLEMLNTIIVLSPNESIMYERGAVLMYTEGWLR